MIFNPSFRGPTTRHLHTFLPTITWDKSARQKNIPSQGGTDGDRGKSLDLRNVFGMACVNTLLTGKCVEKFAV